jgi:hypothetical protein
LSKEQELISVFLVQHSNLKGSPLAAPAASEADDHDEL